MYTIIGVITNTHGIRGQVKVFPYTDDNNRYKLLNKVYIGDEKLEVHVNEVSFFKNLIIVGFKEFNNINQIIKFKDMGIYILDDDRMPLDDNRYYISDLVGLSVLDNKGNKLGVLTEVLQGGANDVYVVKGEKASGMVPAVKEFIIEVNIPKGYVEIKPIEGMFDENWHTNSISRVYEHYKGL